MIIDVVPIGENFQGLSYGDWAAIWTQWLFSEDPDEYYGGHVFFLRGNVNYEPAGGIEGAPRHFDPRSVYERTGDKGESVFERTALFIPIITVTNIMGTTFEGIPMNNEMDLRYFANKDIDGTRQIWATITRPTDGSPQKIVPNLREFRIESPIFRLRITQSSVLIDKMEGGPPSPGVYDAVTAGYFLIIRSLPPSTYRIAFGGKGYGTYITSALYEMSVKGASQRTVADVSGPQTIFKGKK